MSMMFSVCVPMCVPMSWYCVARVLVCLSAVRYCAILGCDTVVRLVLLAKSIAVHVTTLHAEANARGLCVCVCNYVFVYVCLCACVETVTTPFCIRPTECTGASSPTAPTEQLLTGRFHVFPIGLVPSVK